MAYSVYTTTGLHEDSQVEVSWSRSHGNLGNSTQLGKAQQSD